MKFDSESMRKGPIFKSVIIYTVPIILTSILQLLFNAADLIVVGWFSGSDSVAAVGATGSLTNLIVNLFIGLSVGAGVAVASSIEGFCYVSMNAFHQTALNFCGQNYGAGDLKRVNRITFTCLATVAAVGLIVGNIFYLFGNQLLGIYITDSPEAVRYGMERLKFMLIPYFLCGIMDTATGSMRGIGSSVTPMIITIIGVCVMRVVWIYTVFAMPQYHSFSGLFISYPISWLLTFTAVFISYLIIMNRRWREKFRTAPQGE